MLRPRVTPCLLIRNGGLIKTRQFKDDKYVGDPINAVKIFNEKGEEFTNMVLNHIMDSGSDIASDIFSYYREAWGNVD